MDLRVDTILISFSQFCIYHMVKTPTRSVWEGAEVGLKLQLPSLGCAMPGHLPASTKAAGEEQEGQ